MYVQEVSFPTLPGCTESQSMLPSESLHSPRCDHSVRITRRELLTSSSLHYDPSFFEHLEETTHFHGTLPL